MKQINFKIDPQLHKYLKMAAAERGISMTALILRVLYREMRQEDK
jgi:predicted HicB family RNase H-like nuclease